MIFQASKDTLVRIITIGTSILLLSAIVILYATSGFDMWYALLLLMAIFFVAYLYRPLHYNVEQGTLSINRPLNSLDIALSDIKKASLITQDDLGMAIRLFASGGMWGYYGFFYSFKMGKMWWYVTQRQNYVLIQTTDDTQYLLSPDQPEQLINALNKF
jgi:hypothetical protein